MNMQGEIGRDRHIHSVRRKKFRVYDAPLIISPFASRFVMTCVALFFIIITLAHHCISREAIHNGCLNCHTNYCNTVYDYTSGKHGMQPCGAEGCRVGFYGQRVMFRSTAGLAHRKREFRKKSSTRKQSITYGSNNTDLPDTKGPKDPFTHNSQ